MTITVSRPFSFHIINMQHILFPSILLVCMFLSPYSLRTNISISIFLIKVIIICCIYTKDYRNFHSGFPNFFVYNEWKINFCQDSPIGMLGNREDIYSSPHSPTTNISILCPWYTNTQLNRRKDKINSITHTRTFNILYAWLYMQVAS